MKFLIMGLMFFSGPAFAEVLARGKFRPVDGTHMIQGTFEIRERDAGIYLAFGPDFKVSSGPDLRVVLRDSVNGTPMAVVAPLKSFNGFQEYELPMSRATLSRFDRVAIYCLRFHVDFGLGAF